MIRYIIHKFSEQTKVRYVNNQHGRKAVNIKTMFYRKLKSGENAPTPLKNGLGDKVIFFLPHKSRAEPDLCAVYDRQLDAYLSIDKLSQIPNVQYARHNFSYKFNTDQIQFHVIQMNEDWTLYNKNVRELCA